LPKDDPSLIDLILERRLAAAYQKIVRLADLTPLGHEAFVRGPRGRLETPAALFAEAERLGMALDLDLACLAAALALAPPDGLLFVNLRPGTLLWLAARPEWFADALAARPPGSVVLEVTELDRVNHTPDVVRAVETLKSLGLRLALDDIASGYNRLELLVRLGPDYVKLDKPLVANCHLCRQQQQAVRHLINLAAEFGAETIAEHIERKEECDCLKDLGVTYGQGFYLAKPERRDPCGAEMDRTAPDPGGQPTVAGGIRSLG
jgi:EAL domain-containing protein (putative c-di-GMP-specific phosphodiesterase class I)